TGKSAKRAFCLEEKCADLTNSWNSEKLKIQNVRKIKEALDHARIELEIAQREGNLAKAGELTYGVIPDLTKKLTESEAMNASHMLKEAVTEQDIAHIVSRITAIPIDKMMGSEKDKLLKWKKIWANT
ncbi:unnamed protein product, partial [Sphagnum jensenii]